jgi:hypothetical protein
MEFGERPEVRVVLGFEAVLVPSRLLACTLSPLVDAAFDLIVMQ